MSKEVPQAEMIKLALAIRERAYAPYSKFLVGAALLAEDGQIFTGCNVENASYGMAICAERVAVFNAVANGQRKFTHLALVTEGGVSPCGACRQVLSEFSPDMVIFLVDAKKPRKITEGNLWDLLPGRFTLEPPPPPKEPEQIKAKNLKRWEMGRYDS
ncbi:MAG: cytidine deaminase [Pirellulaceae bacterium]|nr:cytidine deaminase [Pirellulaceae bacterium]